VGGDVYVPLPSLEALRRGGVDIRRFQTFCIAVVKRAKAVMHLAYGFELGLGDRLVRDDEHVDVAGLGVEVADGEGAAEIDAEEVFGEGLTNAGDDGVEEGGNVRRRGLRSGHCAAIVSAVYDAPLRSP
jgi:hypothetical protein